MLDQYDDVVAMPPHCWRMVVGGGEPVNCAQLIKWQTKHTFPNGARLTIWSCDGHRDDREWQPLEFVS